MGVEFPYAVVQPYTRDSDRIATAIVVSRHLTAAEAFSALDQMMKRLRRFGIEDSIEMLVVDHRRQPVIRDTLNR